MKSKVTYKERREMKLAPGLMFFSIVFTIGFAQAEVRVSIRSLTGTLIASPAPSCQSRIKALQTGTAPAFDIPGLHFSYLDPVISFDPANPNEIATITNLSIRIDAQALEDKIYRCLLPVNELSFLFGQGTNIQWNGQLPAFAKITINPTCLAMTCGDLKLSMPVQSFEAPTTFRVIGLIKDLSTGSERPIDSVETKTIRYSF